MSQQNCAFLARDAMHKCGLCCTDQGDTITWKTLQGHRTKL